MFKVVFLLMSLFNLSFSQKIEHTNEEKFYVLEEEIDCKESTIVEITKDYIVYCSDKYIIETPYFSLTLLEKPKVVYFKNSYYITYIENNYLKVVNYSQDGQKISEDISFDKKINEEYKIAVFDDSVYVVGTVEGRYSFIVDKQLDKENIIVWDIINKKGETFGGNANEVFIDCEVSKDKMIILVEREKITSANSGGDFNNAGINDINNLLFIIDNEYQIIDYTVLSDYNNIIDISLYNDLIYLNTNNKVIILNLNLDYYNFKEFTSQIMFISERIISLFYNNRIEIIDSISLITLAVKEYDFENSKINVFEDNIIIERNVLYLFDIVDLMSFKVFNEYYKEIEEVDTVYSLYGKSEFIFKNCKEYFDGNTFGIYNMELEYKTSNGYTFNILKEQEVKLITNIYEGMVYPSGYRLIYNGQGILDGEMIVVNYPVYDIGEHEIKITGNNEEKILKFWIVDGECNFSDIIYSDYDYLVYGSECLKIDCIIGEIKEGSRIEVTGNVNCIFDESKIEITSSLEKGINYIYIEKIIYNEDGINYNYYINKIYKVLVKEADSFVNINGLSENFTIDIETNDDGFRGVEVLIEKKGNSNFLKNEKYFLNNSIENVIIKNSNGDDLNIKINILIYDYDCYKFVNICDLEIQKESDYIEVCKLYSKNDDVINKLSIEFEEGINNVSKIKIDNNEVFFSNHINYKEYIIIGACLFGGIVIICIFIKKIKKKRQK